MTMLCITGCALAHHQDAARRRWERMMSLPLALRIWIEPRQNGRKWRCRLDERVVAARSLFLRSAAILLAERPPTAAGAEMRSADAGLGVARSIHRQEGDRRRDAAHCPANGHPFPMQGEGVRSAREVQSIPYSICGATVTSTLRTLRRGRDAADRFTQIAKDRPSGDPPREGLMVSNGQKTYEKQEH
jgi:hypothetical protein